MNGVTRTAGGPLLSDKLTVLDVIRNMLLGTFFVDVTETATTSQLMNNIGNT